MKLGKVTVNDPISRLALGIRQSVVDNLKSYQAFYRENTGDDIPMNQLVEEMVKGFMKEDKEFQRALADAAKPAGKPARGAKD